MSVETFIQAMPKVDLNVQLEGAISKELLLLVAEQTDVVSNYKKVKEFNEWVAKLKQPNFNQIDDIAREVSLWIRHPEDIARAIYELAVNYAKQNIRYAEISIIPALYTDLGMTFQELMEALNDGADRALRAWHVRINWILAIPRDRPRKSDDIARWATSVAAQKGRVVGLSVVGKEDAQPIGQFKKAFTTAEKKDIARITPVYSGGNSPDTFMEVVETVHPTRFIDAWDLLKHEDAIAYVAQHDLPVVMSPSRELRLGRITSLAQFPLRTLLDKGVNVLLATGMPALYNTSLTEDYLAVVNHMGISIDELINISLNSLRAALVLPNEKHALLDEFRAQYQALQTEHLAKAIE